jgi:hypothetical protein
MMIYTKTEKIMAEQKENVNEGLFLATYLISNKKKSEESILGAVNLYVSLLVYTPDQSVTGYGLVSQTTLPALNINSQLLGEYHYQSTMKSCHIMVNVDGVTPYPGIFPTEGKAQSNLQLNMLLEDDWKVGVADFKYFRSGEWITVKQGYLEQVESRAVTLAELSKKIA